MGSIPGWRLISSSSGATLTKLGRAPTTVRIRMDELPWLSVFAIRVSIDHYAPRAPAQQRLANAKCRKRRGPEAFKRDRGGRLPGDGVNEALHFIRMPFVLPEH